MEKVPVNNEIKAKRIILIGSTGNRLGEFQKYDAIKLAEEEGLDLVLVSEGEKPVCRIMDYGKFLYQQKKKSKQGTSHTIKVKELKFGLQTDDNYIDIKIGQARKHLEKGDKVKITFRFRGREANHLDLIRKKCWGIFNKLNDIAEIESPPKTGNGHLSMTIAPKRE